MARSTNWYRRAAIRQAATIASVVTAAAVVLTPTAGAANEQVPLNIINTQLSATAGQSITLLTSGGSGSGKLTFAATGKGCSIKTDHVTDADAGTCSVIATKAAGSGFAKVSSPAVVFTFVGKTQLPLKITTAVTSGLAGTVFKLAAKGGSGTGKVTFGVTGTGCTYNAAKLTVTASTVTNCTVVATKAAEGAYAAASSPAVVFTFVPKTFEIINTTLTGSAGTPITVVAEGGTAHGTVNYAVTGTGCTIGSTSGVLNSVVSASCAVTATLVSGGKTIATSAPVTFTFTFVDNPTVAHPDVATLTGVTGAASAQINDTVDGDNYFINSYYNSGDHWYGYYINDGATVTLTWHVNGSNGQPLANTAVSLLDNLDYSCAKNLTWATSSLNVYAGCGGGTQGSLSGTTDSSGNVSFTLNNTNTDTGNAPSDTTTTGGMEANEGPFSWTDMVLQVGSDTYTGDPTATVNQGTDRVDFIVIPNAPSNNSSTPTYTNPDVATMTSVTGIENASPLDFTSNGDQWFIDSYYSPGDHWNFSYVPAGGSITETWHVVGANGKPMANTAVTLETGFAGSGGSAQWSATGITQNGYVAGTTDPSGNVSFTLTNENSSVTTAPGDLTNGWTALDLENGGQNPWTRMVLIIGTPVADTSGNGLVGSTTDTISANGSAVSMVNQATDLVDFIVVPAVVTPPVTPTYANPDVATMTSVTGIQNASPLDETSNGDQWFIDQYYSPGDHWNLSYVPAGGSITETWHVVGANGKPDANTAVTLETGFAGNDASHWTATGITANGYVAGTTDPSGNVSFTLTNSDVNVATTPSDLTNPATALGLESSNPWTRMALVIGTPVADTSGNGLVGSTTDTISANASAISMVNQATDLVDFIVTPGATTQPTNSATYANPDVATMTSVTGIDNASPLDFTSNGDAWFIDQYYSPGDHWNFSYVPQGGSITETWHVQKSDGTADANATVTLLTGFAGNDASHWTAPGITQNGYVTGTTDPSGNVSFTLTNSDSGVTTAPGDLTNGWTALNLEGSNPWTRMALVIGTPVADTSGNGLVGSTTDTITGSAAAISMVNQATDLVDFIVVPS